MDPIVSYVNQAIANIEKDSSTTMEKQYHIAVMLTTIGKYQESIPYFARAIDELRKVKDSPIWKDLYCTAGACYATTLDFLNEIDLAEQMYSEIMFTDACGCHIGDYAMFLHKRKKDNKKAEILYKKAIELFPNHSSILLKYAGFVRHIKKDLKLAEEYYKKAIAMNPENADALGNYASFLHGNVDKSSLCHELYTKAVKYDPTHTNNYCNFGLYLSEEKQQYSEAEGMYKHALLVTPNHSNTLYNYAVMLDTHCSRKPEAEGLYRRALDVGPRHSYALYNLAVLLEEIALDRSGESGKQEIAELYHRATEVDPRDPAAAADYGRFVLIRFDDYEHGEAYLLKALQLDVENEVALYNLGLLYYKYKHLDKSSTAANNQRVAVEMFRRLVAKNPAHVSGLLQLARLLVDINSVKEQENSTAGVVFADGVAEVVKTKSVMSNPEVDSSKVLKAWMEEVIELYECVIPRHKEAASIVSEYIKVANKYGSARQKMRAIATTEAFMRVQNSADDSCSGDIRKLMEAMKKSK